MIEVSAPLTRLRAQLDALDDELHDLLLRRAELIETVARDAGKTGAKIRPGREAAMLRRRLAWHRGTLPPQTILRFWRELFAGALIIEGGQTVAVVDGDDGGNRLALAREHFGPLTPMRGHHNPAQALADLERDAAQVAVLPALSGDEDANGGWWTALAGNDTGPRRLSIIGKLPFWTRRPEGAPAGVAYVVAAMRPDASGDDRGLIALEFAADTSRTKMTSLLSGAGFAPGAIWLKRGPGETHIHALVEVEGLVEDDDARLAAIAGLNTPAVVIGGFATPLGDDF